MGLFSDEKGLFDTKRNEMEDQRIREEKRMKEQKIREEMRPAEKAALDIIDYGKLVIIAMVMIVVVYKIVEALIGMVPAAIGTIIVGIGSIYFYATNKHVKNKINNWLKGKKKDK